MNYRFIWSYQFKHFNIVNEFAINGDIAKFYKPWQSSIGQSLSS